MQKSKKLRIQNINEKWDNMKDKALKKIGREEGEDSKLKGTENIFNSHRIKFS